MKELIDDLVVEIGRLKSLLDTISFDARNNKLLPRTCAHFLVEIETSIENLDALALPRKKGS